MLYALYAVQGTDQDGPINLFEYGPGILEILSAPSCHLGKFNDGDGIASAQCCGYEYISVIVHIISNRPSEQ
jgi:hypothetical protein